MSDARREAPRPEELVEAAAKAMLSHDFAAEWEEYPESQAYYLDLARVALAVIGERLVAAIEQHPYRCDCDEAYDDCDARAVFAAEIARLTGVDRGPATGPKGKEA